MRRLIALGIMGVGLAAASLPAAVQAHDGSGGFGSGWGTYGQTGGYYGGGYGSYYGNGGHDYQPHWHTTRTPYGGYYAWYGTGRHDYLPHQHSYSPYSYRGYHATPYGATTSHYSRYPSYYYGW